MRQMSSRSSGTCSGPALVPCGPLQRLSMLAVAHASGDAINAVLAATGYNFRRLLAWLRFLLLTILIALGLAAQLKST